MAFDMSLVSAYSLLTMSCVDSKNASDLTKSESDLITMESGNSAPDP
eukprot:CAMPEP_0116898242 /NCGR_PEP_ID=MMETSP0467-20121206/6997_1 /TAXON_ID=283647 /ORGANISM="Mesodinium pulex, Strain SPMC105" /LENGTH=46 /DNA_ID= /DNA_START= /DNA_END= /DNA_ORIENTATION=